MDKLEKKILKQEEAVAETLRTFLKHFNRAWYSIKEPEEELKKFFDITTDGNGIYIFVKTKEGDIAMGYTTDVGTEDLQTLTNYLKRKADVYLR